MADILGPASDNAVTLRPARTISRGITDTWLQDCSGPDEDDGTALGADFFNDILAQLRVALVQSGINRNGDDDMLWRAMYSVGIRYGEDTGGANTIVVACTPAPVLTLVKGLMLIVLLANDVTGPTTLKADGTAAKALVWPDGTALGEDDAKAGALLLVGYDGTKFQLLNHSRQNTAPNYVDAVSAGSQVIPDSTYTVLVDAAVASSKLGDATYAAGVLTIGARTAGLWQISAQVASSLSGANAHGNAGVRITKNGTAIPGFWWSVSTVNGTQPTGAVQRAVPLNAGDVIRMEVMAVGNSGATAPCDGTHTFFNAVRIGAK